MTKQSKDKHIQKGRDIRGRLGALTAARDGNIGDMYAAGVPVTEISEITGLSRDRVSRTIKALRESGRTVERKVTRTSGMWGERRRSLTDHEARTLATLDGAVPRTESGRRVMDSRQGMTLIDEVLRLVETERVVIGAVVSALGTSRQTLQVHMLNRKIAKTARA
jgi:DNA-binding transcriptional ArsR family regulator